MTFLKRPFWVGMRTLINFLSFSGLGFILSRQVTTEKIKIIKELLNFNTFNMFGFVNLFL